MSQQGPEPGFGRGADVFQRIGQRLVAWGRRAQRDLPWRRTRDPYAIWVSEVLLQQTRVEAAAPYYERFLRAFPDLHALATAPEERVLKAWEGLGYYARARNLHRAAQRLWNERGGLLPRTAAEWRQLPGVGDYTAAAIASIAFGADEPALDGNVVRVLCRLFRVRSDPRRAVTRRRLKALAARLIAPGRAGFFNQALMDLGATVCTPRGPRCDACPLRSPCEARARGEQEALPAKRRARPLPHFDIAVAVVRRGGRVLIGRRPPKGLLGGLWEFPGGKREAGETLEDCLKREVREEIGIKVRVVRRLATVRHAYSHFRVALHVFDCRHARGRVRAVGCQEARWVAIEELDDYAFPAANRRNIGLLKEARRDRPVIPKGETSQRRPTSGAPNP